MAGLQVGKNYVITEMTLNNKLHNYKLINYETSLYIAAKF